MIEVKVNPYRDKLESLLKKVRPRLSSTHNLEFKKCFGAIIVNRFCIILDSFFPRFINSILDKILDQIISLESSKLE